MDLIETEIEEWDIPGGKRMWASPYVNMKLIVLLVFCSLLWSYVLHGPLWTSLMPGPQKDN